MAADAELTARALHALADSGQRDAQELGRQHYPPQPVTKQEVLFMLADHDRKLAAAISMRLGQESDLT
jgi:hypothetical protein